MDLYYVEVTDVTGKTWRSDVADEEWTPEQYQQVKDALSDFGNLTHLVLTIDEADHLFNPAHIVAIAIKWEHRA